LQIGTEVFYRSRSSGISVTSVKKASAETDQVLYAKEIEI